MSSGVDLPEEATDGATRRSWPGRFDSGLLLILAVPWLILRFDTTWLFGYAMSPAGFIDPWVYFGFFLDLKQHIGTFKGAYFTTRLTWTVPGAIIYHIFSAIVATYVLHLVVFYAAAISLYLILKVTVSQRAAILATLLMAFHSYFLWAVGWSYMDGAGDAYLLMTVCALTFASRSNRSRWWLFAAGVLAAMTVYCQLFLIVFFPVVLGGYHFARRQVGRDQPSQPWKPFAWGFAAVTVIFGAFNMAINGRFLFFVNSLGTAAKLVVNHNPYVDSTYGWLTGATWLVLPTIAFVGAVLCLSRHKYLEAIPNLNFLLFWQRFYVLSFATMIFWQVVGQPVLQLSTYTSYLIPSAFLALGSQLEIAVHRMRRLHFLLLCGSIVLISVAPLTLRLGSLLRATLQGHLLLVPLALSIVALAIVSSGIRHMQVLGVLVLCIGLATLNANSGPRVWSKAGTLQDPAFQKSAMLAIVDSVRMVQELDPKANLYFWYDVDSRLGRMYRSVASTYLWAYRLQSENFPSLGPKAAPSGRRILILGEDGHANLLLAEASLAKEGLTAKVLATRTIHEGPFHWDVVEVQVASNAGGLTPTPAGNSDR